MCDFECLYELSGTCLLDKEPCTSECDRNKDCMVCLRSCDRDENSGT